VRAPADLVGHARGFCDRFGSEIDGNEQSHGRC
jgi:hypothetical protein